MAGGGGGDTTIGYRYFMGMHLAICKGPDTELLEIFAGERSAWTGNITTNSTITIDSPELFGGEMKEGGIQGDVDVELGASTQGKNAYLQTQLGSDVPAFRGVLCLVLKQVYLTAMSRYPKPWAIVVKRPAATGWYDTARFIGESANGAHIIYECLTDADYGLGLSPGLINNGSFQAVADTLKAEGFGLSLLFSKQTPIEKFIQTILTHISAVLYTDKNTGNFILKLIREPTAGELSSALQLNETNVASLNSFERPSFAEMINEVIISFRPQRAFKDRSIAVQDLASVQAQNGIVSQTLRFPGIDDETIAARVAQRELKQYSTPLAKVSITVNREAWQVSPGDVVKLDWADFELVGMVIRVLSIDYGTLTQGTITIEGTEDIFALPATTYLANQPPLWVDPVAAPQNVPSTGLYEVPFFEINENFPEGLAATVDELTCYLQALPLNPPSASPNHEMQLSPDTSLTSYFEDALGGYVPSAILNAQLDIPKNSAVQDVVIASLTGVVSAVSIGTYAYIENEVVLIETVDLTIPQIGIRRGLLDTNPVVHPMGARIYFVEEFQTISIASFMTDPVAQLGEDVFVRYKVRTDLGLLALANATEFTLPNFFGRQALPYPPKQVTIEGVFYPTARNQGQNNINPTNLQWKSVDRQLQTKPFRNWFNNADVPEDSTVIHNLTIFGEGGAPINRILEVEKPFVVGVSDYTHSLTTAIEAENSGFVFTGSEFLQTGSSVTITNYPIYEIVYITAATGRISRPVQPLVNGEKIYAEFNSDAEAYLIGISNESISYNEANTTNIAYLQVADDTLVGQITGTAGTGVMSGGDCAIAIDTRAEKFWISDTSGVWRDGDPATGVGGYDYSTLTYDHVFLAVVSDAASGTGFTIEMNYGNKPYAHTVPAGFTTNVIWDITDPLTREVNHGSNLTISADGLTATSIPNGLDHNMQAGGLETGGRWYFEAYGEVFSASGVSMRIGIAENTTSNSALMGTAGQGCIWSDDGDLRIDGTFPVDIEGYSVGDRVGVAYDINKQEVTFYKNGAIALDSVGAPGGGGPYSFTMTDARPALGMRSTGAIGSVGRFSFDVQPPAGYRALNIHSHEEDKIRINGTITAEIYVTHDRTFDNGAGSALHTLQSRETWTHTWDRNGWGLQYDNYYGGLQVV